MSFDNVGIIARHGNQKVAEAVHPQEAVGFNQARQLTHRADVDERPRAAAAQPCGADGLEEIDLGRVERAAQPVGQAEQDAVGDGDTIPSCPQDASCGFSARAAGFGQ